MTRGKSIMVRAEKCRHLKLRIEQEPGENEYLRCKSCGKIMKVLKYAHTS